MKPKRRILSLLLAICLVVGIMPTAAFAAENGKALQAGAGAIEENDTVYYGTEQRAWQVLSASGNGGTYSDGKNAVQADSALFLFLRSGLRQLWFDDDTPYSNDYKTSTLRAYLNNENVNATPAEMSGYVSGYFSEAEWANVLETTKTDANTSLLGIDYSDPGLDGDRLFALSANELAVYLGYTDNPASWTAGLGGMKDYWLRSAYVDVSSRAGAVYWNGSPTHLYVGYYAWVRPAFNLNLNSVLFICRGRRQGRRRRFDANFGVYRQRVEADAEGQQPQQFFHRYDSGKRRYAYRGVFGSKDRYKRVYLRSYQG